MKSFAPTLRSNTEGELCLRILLKFASAMPRSGAHVSRRSCKLQIPEFLLYAEPMYGIDRNAFRFDRAQDKELYAISVASKSDFMDAKYELIATQGLKFFHFRAICSIKTGKLGVFSTMFGVNRILYSERYPKELTPRESRGHNVCPDGLESYDKECATRLSGRQPACLGIETL